MRRIRTHGCSLLPIAFLFACGSFEIATSADWTELRARVDSLYSAGNFKTGLAVAEEAWLVVRESGHAEDTIGARILHLMGNGSMRLGRLDSCQALWERSLGIRKRVLGPTAGDVASLLQNLALIKNYRGQVTEAITQLEEVLKIRRANGNMHSHMAANSMTNLANFYEDVGRIDEAIHMTEEAIDIYTDVLGEDHPNVGIALGNLAVYHIRQGYHTKAEREVRRVLTLLEKSNGSVHVDLALPLITLAKILRNTGRFDEAEGVLIRSARILESSLGSQHPDITVSLYALAALHMDRGNYENAEAVFREALANVVHNAGPGSSPATSALHNVAVSLARQERFDEADSIWHEVYAILDQNPEVVSQVAPTVLKEHGIALGRTGNFAAADQKLRRSLALSDSVYGESHPKTGSACYQLARLKQVQGDYDEAMKYALRAFDIRYERVERDAPFLSEASALFFSRDLANSRDLCIATAVNASPETVDVPSIARVVLKSKGQISDVTFSRLQQVIRSDDAHRQADRRVLDHARFELANHFVQTTSDSLGAFKAELARLSQIVDSLEGIFVLSSEGEPGYTQSSEVTLDGVQNAIPDGFGLVEFVRYRLFESLADHSEEEYVALIIVPGRSTQIVSLGNAEEIDARVDAYRMHMRSVAARPGLPSESDRNEFASISGQLRKSIWDPVSPFVMGLEGVMLAPDGSLNLVSFASLLNDNGSWLIEGLHIAYLSTGRDLLRSKPVNSGSGLLALGAPEYDRLHGPAESIALAASMKSVTAPSLRGVMDDCYDALLDSVIALPLTRYEIDQVAERWGRLYPADDVLLLTSDRASEAGFKSQASGRRVLHLATHGFYLDEACSNEEVQEARHVHPLLASGLYLAGANRRADSTSYTAGEDGILTSFEVSSLDLSGTDYAVLSACETGLGSVTQGEGVFGLRRAFQMAGVRAIVCSLWPVSDRATAMFMKHIYSKEGSLSSRVHAAQIREIRRLRGEGLSDHPVQWSAFIVVGDTE